MIHSDNRIKLELSYSGRNLSAHVTNITSYKKIISDSCGGNWKIYFYNFICYLYFILYYFIIYFIHNVSDFCGKELWSAPVEKKCKTF